MVKKRLSDALDEVNNIRPPSFWYARLIEMKALLNEKKYSALERRIQDLLESDRATGRVKPPKKKSLNTDE